MENITYTLAHVGINGENAQQAQQLCDALSAMFGWPSKTGNSSCFAGKGIEIMKEPYLGTCGHIAIGVNDIEGAICQLEARGIAFDPATRKTDKDGNTKAIYLAGEYGGFALHLLQV